MSDTTTDSNKSPGTTSHAVDVKVDIQPTSATRKMKRERNYSHLSRNPDSFDEVECEEGILRKIPANMGSSFWAILRVMYSHANKRVYPNDLTKQVDEEMRDYDEEKWELYCSKEQTTVWKRGSNQREVKKIKPWQERIIGNAKTLTRKRDYGMRLYERGHIMRYEYDERALPYFILYTDLSSIGK